MTRAQIVALQCQRHAPIFVAARTEARCPLPEHNQGPDKRHALSSAAYQNGGSIMSDQHDVWGGHIRKLWPTETDKFRDHLLRLDADNRRMRFASPVSDQFISDYAARMTEMGSIVFAYMSDDRVMAAAELRKLSVNWEPDAEAAFSVEAPYQHNGIGTALMGHVIRSARNRCVKHLYMSCLAENWRMRAIARKYHAKLRFEYGEVMGEIIPNEPNHFSYFGEVIDDRVGFMLAVLDLQARMIKAA
jgi:GNAT superfamily N-acetyltransferase